MRRSHEQLYRVLSVIFGALACLGCVRRYTEPTPTEPHAIVKFRLVHHVVIPRSLDELLRIDGEDAGVPPGVPTDARLRAVRVRPVLSSYRYAASYFHTETRTRMEVTTESYNCGTYQNPRTCTRTVTRNVTDHVRVTDAACDVGLTHVPMAGAIYVVQFDFYGHDSCSASCYRQLPGVGAEFELVACGPGEPPVEVGAGGEVLVGATAR